MKELVDKLYNFLNKEIEKGVNSNEDWPMIDTNDDFIIIYKGDYDEIRAKECMRSLGMSQEEMIDYKRMDKKEIEQIRKIIKLKRLKDEVYILEGEIDLINK